ncbi:MAG: VanW family protein [Firmicutes bacterium]|nr:VanW family protein [Bacillota bacterium]
MKFPRFAPLLLLLLLLLLLPLLLAAPARAEVLAEVTPEVPPADEQALPANSWRLTLLTDDGQPLTEFSLPQDYTGGGITYTLSEPFIPLRPLAESLGVPLVWQKFADADCAVWAADDNARLFIANRPNVLHFTADDNGSWQPAREIQYQQPLLVGGTFCVPLSYLACLGLAYDYEASSGQITVYAPHLTAADPYALWSAAQAPLADILPPPAHLLATATTLFDPAEINRCQNILLAAGALHGLVIAPGEEFSFNTSVGPRTADRGYRTAIVFIDEKAVPGIGGGVCQVSTTVYQAALQAGLTVTERHPHSLPVNYAPAHRDATVAWGALDLRWRNDFDHPVQLACHIKDGSLTVKIYQIAANSNTNRFLGNLVD